MTDKNILEAARKNGYYTALLLLVGIAVQVYLTYKFPEQTFLLVIASFIGTLAVLYTYRLMLLGIAVIAKESENQILSLSTRYFINATVISAFIVSLMGVITELITNAFVSLLLLISLLTSLLYLGIASLKISKGFITLEEKYGKTAKQAVFWHKVSGYLLVTVILSVLGLLTSLVADYFMWKLISMRLEEYPPQT